MNTYPEKLQREADNLYDAIEQAVDSNAETMKLIDELREIDRELTLLEGR
jgi:hypothetical protein